MNIDAGIFTNIVLAMLAMSGAWIGAYVAIKADLARLHERIAAALLSAEKAHERLDEIMKNCGDRRRSCE